MRTIRHFLLAGSTLPSLLAAIPDRCLYGGDWPFIATALAGNCPVITGNARHFPQRVDVQVMTAREWVARVG